MPRPTPPTSAHSAPPLPATSSAALMVPSPTADSHAVPPRRRPNTSQHRRSHAPAGEARCVHSAPATFSTPTSKKRSHTDDANRESSKRHNGPRGGTTSATVGTTHLELEMRGTTFRSAGFFRDFIYGDADAARADRILHQLCKNLGSSPQVPGLDFKPLSNAYWCVPQDYTDVVFPRWLCHLANTIAALNTSPTTTPPVGPVETPTWTDIRTREPSGANNDRRRPDFGLFPNATSARRNPPDWRDFLIVGEHQSKGSSYKASFHKLFCYVEQIFIAQPFRKAVFGILTRNTLARFEVWRFDRAGGLGSLEQHYTTGEGLRALVLTLEALTATTTTTTTTATTTTLPLDLFRSGFHTAGVTWAEGVFPIDAKSIVSANLPGINRSVIYKDLVFCASGLVSRGTRVWTGVLRGGDSEVEVAIKESWRSIGRDSEGHLYGLAAARGVHGLPGLIYHAAYEDIHHEVRHGHIPDDRDEYKTYIAAHNRIFSRLILNKVGLSISKPLPPLAISRALLAGLIGHASLFFQGNILHRDISPYNILAFPTGVSTPLPKAPETLPGLYGHQTQLYGCLIDLDYALDIRKPTAASGAKDRTGTFPFIAIAVLQGGVSHRYRHDLESLLYVLLYVALYPRPELTAGTATGEATNEPGRKVPLWDPRDPLKVWFTASEEDVADHKELRIVTSRTKFDGLLEEFKEGFRPFKAAARRLRLSLWGPGPASEGVCQLLGEGPPAVKPRHGGIRKQKNRKSGPRSWLHPDEVRPGVSNWQAYLEIREAFEDLVDVLENPAAHSESDSSDDGEGDAESHGSELGEWVRAPEVK